MGEATPIIDPEFRALIPPPRDDERATLEANLVADGCRDPLVVWRGHGILLDGHNRLEICDRLGIAYQITAIELSDRDAAKLWILDNQLGRRNLIDYVRGVLALQKKAIHEARAKANQKARKGDQPGASPAKLPDLSPVNTRAEVAKDAGLGERTIAKIVTVEKNGSPELKAAASKGHISIDAAEKIAKLPEDKQKAIVAAGKDSVIEAAKASQAQEREDRARKREAARKAELEARAKAADESLPLDAPKWEVRQGDCLDGLKALGDEGRRPRLIFADPPYNIGVPYGDHYDDDVPGDEFERRLRDWISACYRALADDGSLWLLLNHEWGYVAATLAVDVGFTLRQWITWYESFGVNQTSKFNRCSRPLLWLTKHRERFVFNDVDEVRRPSDRQAKYRDERANPDGKLWDDVWGINPPIPRLAGTHAERIPGFPTQLPLALLRPIVACASEADDLVVDPFCGSGTTGAACIELGRRFVGLDLSEANVKAATTRLKAHRRDS